MNQKASIGRIVHYRLSSSDAERVNRRRPGTGQIAELPAGAQGHSGNVVREGDVVALIIAAAWGGEHDTVNGQAFLDGNDQLWVTSAALGTLPGTWSWPERV